MRTLAFSPKHATEISRKNSRSPRRKRGRPLLLFKPSLTDAMIRRTKPEQKPLRLADGEGLFLLVQPDGSKLWRFDYRIAGTRKTISFGNYRDVTLMMARERRREARDQVAKGIDPSAIRRRTAARAKIGVGQTFEAVAREWIDAQAARFSAATTDKLTWICESFLFPAIGRMPIDTIEPTDILTALRTIEAKRRHDTAHRARTLCSQVFRYAISTGRAARDQSADLRGALLPIVRAHHAALTDPKAIGAMLRAIDGFDGSVVVHCALQLLPLTFVRPGELRMATWSEIDLKARLWRIPAARMKMRAEHLVPLSKQALDVLKAVHRVTGRGRYVFPSFRGNGLPMSENALNAALRRMGYAKDEATAHGWRATARTLLDEVLRFPPEVIEAQLAHAPRGALGDTYNRALRIEDRRLMMDAWAGYLDKLKAR